MAEPTEVGSGFFRVFADYSQLVKGMEDARKKLESGGNSLEKTFSESFKRGMSNSGELLNTIGEKAGQVFGILSSKAALAGQGVALIGAALKEARDSAIEFNREFNRFTVLVADQPGQITKARSAIRDLGAELGSVEERSAALRGAFLQVGNVEDAKKVAEAALKLSDVLSGDLNGSLEAVTTTMAAFKDQSVSAEKASETLFQIFRSGGGNVEEVGFLMARVGTLADAAGVKLDDLASVMVALGNAGLTTRQRMMTLFDLIGNLTQGADKFRAVGIDIKKVLAEEGLGGALRKLNELTGGNVEMLQQFGVSAQATAGTLALMRAAVAGTLPELDKLGKSAEEGFGAAQQERAKEYTRQIKALSDAWGELKTELGEAFVPTGTTIIGFLRLEVDGLRQVIADAKANWESFKSFIGAATGQNPLDKAVEEAKKRQAQGGGGLAGGFVNPLRPGLGAPMSFQELAGQLLGGGATISPDLLARGQEIFNRVAAANAANRAAGVTPGAAARPGGGVLAATAPLALSVEEKAILHLEEVERKAAEEIDKQREANFRNELQRVKDLEDLKRAGYLQELDLIQQVETERAKIEGRAAPSVVGNLLARDAVAAEKFRSDIGLATDTGESKLRDLTNQLNEARAQLNIFTAQPGQNPTGAQLQGLGGNLLVNEATGMLGPTPEGPGALVEGGELNRAGLQARAKALLGTGKNDATTAAALEQYTQLKSAVAQGEMAITEEKNRQSAERAMITEKFRQEEFKNVVDDYKQTLAQTRAYYSELDAIRSQRRSLGTLTVAGDIAGSLEAAGRPQATARERAAAAIEAKNAIVKAEQDVFDIRKSLLQRTAEDEVNFERQRVERAVSGSQERLDAEKRYISALNSLYQQRSGLAGTAIGLSMGLGRKTGTLADVEADAKRQLAQDQTLIQSALRGGSVNLQALEQARGRVNLNDQYQSVGGIGAALKTGLISQKDFLAGAVGGGQFGQIGASQDRLTGATVDLTSAVEKLTDIMATVGGQLANQDSGNFASSKRSEQATDYFLNQVNNDREAQVGRNR